MKYFTIIVIIPITRNFKIQPIISGNRTEHIRFAGVAIFTGFNVGHHIIIHFITVHSNFCDPTGVQGITTRIDILHCFELNKTY